ncbi:MAG: DUF3785 family protein [Clostridia bacterium]
MKKYNFVYDNKEYELGEDNCSYVINDEEHPVAGIEKLDVLELLCQQETVDFELAYYDHPCQNCLAGKKEKDKFFKFLEYHFFIFTKKDRYVISSISKEYENSSFTKLLKQGIADNSYVVSVAVCVECGEYSIDIEQCDV